jgi:hypothetical protein
MKKSSKKAIAVGAGVAALTAAAVGTYFLTGKHSGNRKKVKKWAGDMQKDVVKQLKKVENVTEAAYKKAVDVAATNYKGLKNISALELANTANELKGHWAVIQKELKSAAKTAKHIRPTGSSKKRSVKVKKVTKKAKR